MNNYNYNSTTVYVSQLSLEIKSGINVTVAKFEDTDSPTGYITAYGGIIKTGSNNILFLGPTTKINISLQDPLSSPDKSSLDNIITTHTPNPSYPIPTGSL